MNDSLHLGLPSATSHCVPTSRTCSQLRRLPTTPAAVLRGRWPMASQVPWPSWKTGSASPFQRAPDGWLDVAMRGERRIPALTIVRAAPPHG